MPDGLQQRVNALEKRADRLDQLVDGQEPWSHRTRLHGVENEQAAARLERRALAEGRAQHEHDVDRRFTRTEKLFALGAGVYALALQTVLLILTLRHH